MKPRPWRLTRQAESSLVEIARWTLDVFGARQADLYRDQLISRCENVAQSVVQTRSCAQFFDMDLPEELRFVRAGAHLIIVVESADELIVVDFLHPRGDLPRRILDLMGRRE